MQQQTVPDPDKLPRHVAIIMDGNGRWAKERRLPRVMGHKAGTEAVRRVVRAARELGISVLTLYAFSTENWRRPAREVETLMGLLKSYLTSELNEMLENGISLRCSGQIERLPPKVRGILEQAVSRTARRAIEQDGMVLNLALSYGGRSEITRAARLLAEKCLAGELMPEEITEEVFSGHLYTAGLPDPDLVIRTSGEYRLSNFLLWQASYAELYITRTKWPDFGTDQLVEALAEFQGRQRRFGGTGKKERTE